MSILDLHQSVLNDYRAFVENFEVRFVTAPIDEQKKLLRRVVEKILVDREI